MITLPVKPRIWVRWKPECPCPYMGPENNRGLFKTQEYP
jgi:hypothetical protein